MSSTSQKHKNFVGEPMGDKLVTDIAGIGEVAGKKLEASGYDKAFVLLGQFLLLKKNKEIFKDWLKDEYSVNARNGENCSTCLKEWCDAFL